MAFYEILYSGANSLDVSLNPQNLMNHSLTFCGKSLILFGGTDGTQSSQKIFIYDILTNMWNNPFKNYSPNLPPPRFSHVAIFDPPEEVFVYGGTDANGVFGDIWIFNIRTISWNKVEGLQKVPPPRFGHYGALFSEKLYFFAGKGGVASLKSAVDLEDVVVYDLLRRQWNTEISITRMGDVKGINFTAVQSLDLESMFFVGKNMNKLYVFNFLENNWQVQTIAGSPPPRRIKASLCHAYENALLYFGGMDDKIYYNEVQLIFHSGNEFIWEKVELTGKYVPPRIGHTMINVSEIIYLFGGGGKTKSDSKFEVYSDFYMLDMKHVPTWEIQQQGGAPPVPVAQHVMVYIEGKNKIFVHGGVSETKIVSNTYFFNLKDWTWEIVDSYRKFTLMAHTAIYHKDRDLVYIHGGANDKQLMMQMLSFNTETKEFKEMITSKMPAARSGHISFIYKGFYFIYGGYSANEGYLNSFFYLDLNSLEWNVLKCHSIDHNPQPEARVGASFCFQDHIMFMLGGIRNGKIFDDIWYMDFDYFRWNKIDSVVYTQFLRFGHISEFVDTKRILIFGGASLFQGREPQDILNKSILMRLNLNKDYVVKAPSDKPNFDAFNDPVYKGAIKKRIYHKSCKWNDKVVVFGGSKDSNIYTLNFRLVADYLASIADPQSKIDPTDLELEIEQNEFKQFKVVESATSTVNLKKRDKPKEDQVFLGEDYKYEKNK